MDESDARKLQSLSREHTLCGGCKASSFLIWDYQKLSSATAQRSELCVLRIDNDFQHNLFPEIEDPLDEPKDISLGIIVRCAFYRMNVPDPASILVCEGFRAKKGSKDGAECVED